MFADVGSTQTSSTKCPRAVSLSNDPVAYRALPKGSVPASVSNRALAPSLATGSGNAFATNRTGLAIATGALAIQTRSSPRHDAAPPVFGAFQLSAPARSRLANAIAVTGGFTNASLFIGSFTTSTFAAVVL